MKLPIAARMHTRTSVLILSSLVCGLCSVAFFVAERSSVLDYHSAPERTLPKEQSSQRSTAILSPTAKTIEEHADSQAESVASVTHQPKAEPEIVRTFEPGEIIDPQYPDRPEYQEALRKYYELGLDKRVLPGGGHISPPRPFAKPKGS